MLSEHSFILGYLGSLGPDYLLEEMVQVFKALLNLKKDSIFLFISNNYDPYLGDEINSWNCHGRAVSFRKEKGEDKPFLKKSKVLIALL